MCEGMKNAVLFHLGGTLAHYYELVGPRAVGVDSILIDRHRFTADNQEKPIKNLRELVSRMELLTGKVGPGKN
jgi:hypothetical protein